MIFQHWCQCGTPTTSTEECPPEKCVSCNYTGDQWDSCAEEELDVIELRKATEQTERLVERLEKASAHRIQRGLKLGEVHSGRGS